MIYSFRPLPLMTDAESVRGRERERERERPGGVERD